MNLIGSNLFGLDFLAIITAYLLLFYGDPAVGAFACGQGLIIDLFSGGVRGLFTFLYLSVFGVTCLCSRFFNLQYPKGQVLIVSMAVLLGRFMFFIMLTLFSREVVCSKSFLWISAASAIGTGLIAPILFRLFDRMRAVTLKDSGSASAEQL